MSVDDQERVGRRINNADVVRRVKAGRPAPLRVFRPRVDEDCISMDLMDRASVANLSAIAQSEAEDRPCHGWLALRAENAREDGRAIVEAATPANPYHAHLIFPVPRNEQHTDELNEHANRLAHYAGWVPIGT